MLLGMFAAGLRSVLGSLRGMSLRGMGVMGASLVTTFLILLRGLPMVSGGAVMMIGGGMVVFRRRMLVSHGF